MSWCHPSTGNLLYPTGTQELQGSQGRQRKHIVPTSSSPHTPQRGKVSKLPSEALTLRWQPFRGSHPFERLHLWQCASLSITCAATNLWFADAAWEGTLYVSEPAVFQQWQFRGEQTSPNLPFTLCIACFCQETCVRQLMPPPISYLNTSVSLAAKTTMWARNLNLQWPLPVSVISNARRMVEDFVPAESNTLWSSAKGKRIRKPSSHLIEEAGGNKKRQCSVVNFLHLHNLLIFKEFTQGCGSYCTPDLVYQLPHYTDSILGFTHHQPFSFFSMGKRTVCLLGEGKCLQLIHPHVNHI